MDATRYVYQKLNTMSQPTITKNSYLDKVKTILTKDWIEFAISIYVAVYLLIYGFGKMAKGQFTYDGPLLEKSVNELSGFELTWVFFGHSYAYVIIIGTAQIIGAVMLIPKTTRIFGALMLIPVLVNIVLVDIFYGIPFGATMNAIYFLVGLVAILFLNKEKIIEAIKMLFLPTKDKISLTVLFQYLLISILGAVIFEGFKIILSNIVKQLF